MRKTWLIFSQAVTVALAALFVVATLKPEWVSQAPRFGLRGGGSAESAVTVVQAPAPSPSAGFAPTPALVMQGSLSGAARQAAPAVVSVFTSAKVTRNQRDADPWFRYFFGDQDPSQPQSGMGSGVIVAPEGYILTNNHVVERMERIEVQLSDGRRTVAKVIGADPDTDLAVLKIELDRLPSITLGDSENLQVGDVVLAIGNPFGVGQTVTAGIVSALGRNQLGINTFENFIQTDAAINPGNSGGALVDAEGRLMGINSAIYSRSGGNMGIGFAIPVSTARQVMDGLIKDGQVTRGWIGVEPRDITQDLADTFELKIDKGVLITGVLQGGPADAGGVKPGDVVTTVAGKAVGNTAQLLNAVAGLKPGTRSAIGIQRGAEAISIDIEVAKRPATRRVVQRRDEGR